MRRKEQERRDLIEKAEKEAASDHAEAMIKVHVEYLVSLLKRLPVDFWGGAYRDVDWDRLSRMYDHLDHEMKGGLLYFYQKAMAHLDRFDTEASVADDLSDLPHLAARIIKKLEAAG